MQAMILRLHFPEAQAPVWRRLVVPTDLNFEQLGAIFMTACGYSGKYKFEFLIEALKARITNNDELLEKASFLQSKEGKAYLAEIDEELYPKDLSVSVVHAKKLPIFETLKKYPKIAFLYDFTDEWLWQVQAEEVIEDYEGLAPRVLEGLGTAPFEDSGGLQGYYEMIDALTQKDHPEGDAVRAWIETMGLGFFDLEKVNETLKVWQEG